MPTNTSHHHPTPTAQGTLQRWGGKTVKKKKKTGTQAVCDEIVEMADRQDWNSGNIHGHVNIKGGTFHEIPTPEKELQVTVTVMTAQRRTISLAQG